MGGRLEGRTALVTGGTRGIGLEIARAFLTEGATVIVASRKAEGVAAAVAALEGAGGRVYGRPCHVGDKADVEALVAWAHDEVGTIDTLVNNAGTNPFFGPFMKLGEEAFDKTIDVNLKSAWRLSVLVARRLIEEGRPGAIVNITSVMGLRAAPLQGVYGMTKAALVSFTQTLAMELGEAGIRVNAIAPGLVDTKLASAITRSEGLSRTFTDRTAMRRVADPTELAGAAVFLASDEASFVTGQTLSVDGGYTAT